MYVTKRRGTTAWFLQKNPGIVLRKNIWMPHIDDSYRRIRMSEDLRQSEQVVFSREWLKESRENDYKRLSDFRVIAESNSAEQVDRPGENNTQ